ncbi:hypothetical protein TRIATDRAFT_310207 [Trichoderma atroviride IMI 206040]|uniref:Transcription factor domain-containing protein n=2 Tax=Hypocrea atroviridis TaxID=63577 RepID=G9P225_HYPAI|nr:uncharacterized protein TRIATDRAFT_310207 [Trichoderma atroviride IMI 206040]EHK42620.1 hypothetical protein TRIATDRAFT_310207 [Trichoderma atroviride IMI 206040]
MSQLFRLAHAHVRWMLYRPLLQFVSQGFRAEGLYKRLYMCAEACIGASRNIIDIIRDIQANRLLSGAHWFPIHATYVATLALIYPIFEQNQVPTLNMDAIEGSFEGMNVLKALAKNGLAMEMSSSSARVRSQTYSTSTSPQYATPQTPTHSTEFNIQRDVAPSQQPGANQHDSDMMRMLLQPEMVVAQADNSDDVFTHFGMDMFYANHHC